MHHVGFIMPIVKFLWTFCVNFSASYTLLMKLLDKLVLDYFGNFIVNFDTGFVYLKCNFCTLVGVKSLWYNFFKYILELNL
jgi:hypothetical protein